VSSETEEESAIQVVLRSIFKSEPNLQSIQISIPKSKSKSNFEVKVKVKVEVKFKFKVKFKAMVAAADQGLVSITEG